jgi:hypothetical protein
MDFRIPLNEDYFYWFYHLRCNFLSPGCHAFTISCMLFSKQAKDKSISFIEVKSLYLSTPPPHFNPLLTSCFSRRRHIVARRGVTTEGKNNWHQCCVRLLQYDCLALWHVALRGTTERPVLVFIVSVSNICFDYRVPESLFVFLMSFPPCIVIQPYNINQQNTPLLN